MFADRSCAHVGLMNPAHTFMLYSTRGLNFTSPCDGSIGCRFDRHDPAGRQSDSHAIKSRLLETREEIRTYCRHTSIDGLASCTKHARHRVMYTCRTGKGHFAPLPLPMPMPFLHCLAFAILQYFTLLDRAISISQAWAYWREELAAWGGAAFKRNSVAR